MPCKQIIPVTFVAWKQLSTYTGNETMRGAPSTVMYASPLSAVMNTKATSLPEAAFMAASVSVSLKEDVMFVPFADALPVIASIGYKC